MSDEYTPTHYELARLYNSSAGEPVNPGHVARLRAVYEAALAPSPVQGADDREPQPSDGPDFHAEHAAWSGRQGADDRVAEIAELIRDGADFQDAIMPDVLRDAANILDCLAAYPSHAALDEVRAQALEDAAEVMEGGLNLERRQVKRWLRARAAEYRANAQTVNQTEGE